MARMHVGFLLLSGVAACDTATSHDTASCTSEAAAEPYVQGMIKQGERLSFQLIEATPSPPARGDNTWLVEVTQASAPLTDASLTVKPFMPAHNHGTGVDATITPVATHPGRYSLTPVNLWMPGLWEVTISASAAGVSKDAATFAFCVDQ